MLTISAAAFGQRHVQSTPAELQELLTATLQAPAESRNQALPVIRDKATAVAVAEALAVNVYGKQQIESEKPYQTALLDGYWVVTGSLPMGSKGGVFEIILDAKDGRVLRLTHGK